MDENKNLVINLDKFVKEKINIDQFSGTILVAKRDEIIYEMASGFANKNTKVLNTINTKFNLGSANKMFTAVAIGQLIEQKKLSLFDSVGKILPDYPNEIVRNQVKIENLLSHTSGMGSFIDIKYRKEFLEIKDGLITISKVVDLFKNRPLSFPVGELHYSSDGYELLGLIIEKISNQSYYEFIKQNIYVKANMPNTDCYQIDINNPQTDIAIGYTNRDPLTNEYVVGVRTDNLNVNFIKGTAGGSGYSTCHDMFNFTKSLLKNELINPEITELLMTRVVKEGSKGNQTKYEGYGFQIFDIDGFKRVGHPGRFSGVNTRIDMYPEIYYTVIVLSNYDPPSAFDIAEKAGEIIMNPRIN